MRNALTAAGDGDLGLSLPPPLSLSPLLSHLQRTKKGKEITLRGKKIYREREGRRDDGKRKEREKERNLVFQGNSFRDF